MKTAVNSENFVATSFMDQSTISFSHFGLEWRLRRWCDTVMATIDGPFMVLVPILQTIQSKSYLPVLCRVGVHSDFQRNSHPNMNNLFFL